MGPQPQLVETLDLDAPVIHIDQLAERLAPPQRQGVLQRGQRPLGAVSPARTGIEHGPLEAMKIQIGFVDAEHVAGRMMIHDHPGDLPAKPREVRVQGTRPNGLGIRPQHVGQAIGGHDPVPVQQ